MMENALLLLMLVVAIGIGWFMGRRERSHESDSQQLLEAATAGAGGLSLRDRSPNDLQALADSLRISVQTAETHLELGRLCRRRGEADKAIHIHQRLLESNWLSERWTMQAKLELARDYHSAGLLDRAETLLLELMDQDLDAELQEQTGGLLISLYEQERDWEHAIQVAARLTQVAGQPRSVVVAHYHCEIAEEALGAGNYRRSERKLAQALQCDESCARALILAARCATKQGRPEIAREHYRQLALMAPEFLPEVMNALVDSFEASGDEAGLVALLRETLDRGGHTSVLLLLSEMITRDGGRDMAVQFMAANLREHPSLAGLQRLVELHLSDAGAGEQDTLQLLHQLLAQMNRQRPAYLCGQCGFSGNHLHWYCPRCHGWGQIKPVSE